MTSFTPEQTMYLRGLMAGVEAKRRTLGLPLAPVAASVPSGTEAGTPPSSPERAAQDRTLAAGRALSNEEQAKRRSPPLARFDRIADDARNNRFPKGADVFLTKYEGLFHVAPAEDGFMCRLRIPNGELTGHQLRGIARISARHADGAATVTTRNNLQLRRIGAASAVAVLVELNELGIFPRGSGADNVRNVTGSPTAGIDPDELLDTRPDARGLHHYLLRHPELSGLPRKFNIAFDGGGRVSALAETNDVAFVAVRVGDEILYRLRLGGITGHRDFARPTGVVVPPADTSAVSGAILRVFLAHGDRSDRKRARLKYLLDDWGFSRFLDAVEAELGRPLRRVDESAMSTPAEPDRSAHLGVHRQKGEGLNWIGVALPVGRMENDGMEALAAIAERHGAATLRLTVWQNLLIGDVSDEAVPAALADLAAAGFTTDRTAIRAGLVACTGSAGCRFGNAETKGRGDALARFLDGRLVARGIALDTPLNIHLTGCPNSCAQHLVADIGLLGARVERGEDTVDGFDLHVGGGTGATEAIGRLVGRVDARRLGPHVLAFVDAWIDDRTPGEGFRAWSSRQDDGVLAGLLARGAVDPVPSTRDAAATERLP